MNAQPKVALVIVDHGSRSAASNGSLEDVAREVAAASGDLYTVVLAAHMDLAPPTIADAFDAAVASGAGFVVVALYFLAPGRHSETDVPRLAAEAARRHPGVGFTVTASLGPHESLSQLVLARVAEALQPRRN
jgi:sirohydrochlorin ferrochelatase